MEGAADDLRQQVSPGLTAGSGLKLSNLPFLVVGYNVSPGLTAGGGLKLHTARKAELDHVYLPA